MIDENGREVITRIHSVNTTLRMSALLWKKLKKWMSRMNIILWGDTRATHTPTQNWIRMTQIWELKYWKPGD